jgi:hypothetical protein
MKFCHAEQENHPVQTSGVQGFVTKAAKRRAADNNPLHRRSCL